jgi:hypothetical protein
MGRGRIGLFDDTTGGNSRPRLRPRNNQTQNKQFENVARDLGLDKKQQREFHDYISGQFDLSYADLLQLAKDFFGIE